MKAHSVRAFTTSISSDFPTNIPHRFRRHRLYDLQYAHHRFRIFCSQRPAAERITSRRRDVLLVPLIASLGAAIIQYAPPASKAEEINVITESPQLTTPPSPPPPPSPSPEEVALAEEEASWRVYDATVIGEPLAVSKNRDKVWEKLMNARIVYLGEAEQVPTNNDSVLEIGVVKSLRRRCIQEGRTLTLALECFSLDLQEQLNQFIDKKMDGETLKSYVSNWAAGRWVEYEPLLNYCRENGIRVVACGTPAKVVRTVQAEGIRGLSKGERKMYAPPAGSGIISGFTSISQRSVDINSTNHSVPFVQSSYMAAQAKVVEDYTMSQIIMQALNEGGPSGMLVVVTGASHVIFGTKGTGVPARISRKMQKRNQAVILLNPERQFIRREGDAPDCDFLWYSAAIPCSRNCFDRAEIAKVMNAAGRHREALPQDIQKGLDLGLVSPEVLQNFFDLEKYPLLKELVDRFQGFRERLLADPKFLHRLAFEETISITTTLIAQYERRKENFFEELDYVITDTVRGSVVDFFTVWLPAPTLSYLPYSNDASRGDRLGVLQALLGSIPDNAFQKSVAGREFDIAHRVASVMVGGMKLFGVGFVSSLGAVASSNALLSVRRIINSEVSAPQRNIRSPVLKTAFIYGSFLGLSANLRYQIIAGVLEHRVSDAFPSQTILVNMLSFVARTVNSYWGTQQWVDLARYTGLQSRKTIPPPPVTGLQSHNTIPPPPVTGLQSHNVIPPPPVTLQPKSLQDSLLDDAN